MALFLHTNNIIKYTIAMSQAESQTQKLFIEVARNLFATQGKRNVTMNDIAAASKKGRRTLYLYFKNKEEIYRAVIENEIQILHKRVSAVYKKQGIPARQKLSEFITTHLEATKDAVIRNGSLRAEFFRDIYAVEKARRKIDKEEIEMIKNILLSGLKNDSSNIDTSLTAMIVFYAMKGLEIPYLRQSMGADFNNNKETIVEFVLQSIKF